MLQECRNVVRKQSTQHEMNCRWKTAEEVVDMRDVFMSILQCIILEFPGILSQCNIT